MQDNNLNKMQYEDVEDVAIAAAQKLVGLVNEYGNASDMNETELQDYFAGKCISLLTEKVVIPNPEEDGICATN